MIKLALSDMDNTLLPLGHATITANTLDAIHEAIDAGVRFAPATGRGLDELCGFLRGDKRACATSLVSNGQVVYLDGECVKTTYTDHGALERALEVTSQIPGAFLLLYMPGRPTMAVRATQDEVAPHLHKFPLGLDLVDGLPDEGIIKATVNVDGGVEHVEQVGRELRVACPELDFVSPVPNWFDIMPHGWNKASGIRILMDAMGLEPQQAVCFGDSDNDIAMLEMLPNSCVVANANDAARAVARHTIGACVDDAVADALRQLASVAGTDRLPAFLRAR